MIMTDTSNRNIRIRGSEVWLLFMLTFKNITKQEVAFSLETIFFKITADFNKLRKSWVVQVIQMLILRQEKQQY